MELKIKEITFPEAIEFNFDELKQEITDKVETYKNLVYSEDQIKEAKKDRANLNKFVKALSDERIKVKKQCLQPYEAFEKKVNELSKIVQEPINLIDQQVKGFEEQQKQEKLDAITDAFNSMNHPEWLHLSQIMNEKWLNASTSMKAVIDEITLRIEKVDGDIDTLESLPEFGFEAVQVYKSSLDINKAISEAKRMADIAKAKAEAEAKKQEEEFTNNMNPPVVPETIQNAEPNADVIAPAKQWIKFAAHLTVEEAFALKQFFNEKGIDYKAI